MNTKLANNKVVRNLSNSFGKATAKIRKNSPEILVVAGVIGTVTSAVLACKATLKLDDILDGSKEKIDQIHTVSQDESMFEDYSKNDAKKDLTIVYAQTGLKIAKLYAPSVILGALSISGIIGSNYILKKRNLALAAAYTTVDQAFKDYRGHVAERFGEKVDKELRYGLKAKKIEEQSVDPETGKKKTTKSVIDVVDGTCSGYARFFDNTCAGYEDGTDFNLMFLKIQQSLANDTLKARGFIFLNDVYDLLGMSRTKEGQVVGWIYKPDNSVGDNYVDFGVTITNRMKEDGTYEEVIMIDPNVDGYVLDQM